MLIHHELQIPFLSGDQFFALGRRWLPYSSSHQFRVHWRFCTLVLIPFCVMPYTLLYISLKRMAFVSSGIVEEM